MNALYSMLIVAGIGQMQCAPQTPPPNMTPIACGAGFRQCVRNECRGMQDDDFWYCWQECLRKWNCYTRG